MRIAFGQHVFSADGRRLGTVSRVVMNPRDDRVDDIVIHRGVLLREDKLVEREAIERVTDDGVQLAVTARDVEQAPAFRPDAYYVWAPEWPEGAVGTVPGWEPGAILYAGPPFTGAIAAWSGGLFDLAPIPAREVRPGPSIPEDDVVLGVRASVDDAQGHHLGRLREVDTDKRGALTGVVETDGHVRHHDADVPAARIATVRDEHLQLNAPKTES